MTNILSIETSCDESAISFITFNKERKDGDIPFEIKSNELISQSDLHKDFGGVYPEIAKREHTKSLPLLLIKILKEHSEKGYKINDEHKDQVKNIFSKNTGLIDIFLKEVATYKPLQIDGIAVTVGPGLEPSLYVGVNFAKALSMIWNIPIIPVNHMEGHFVSAFIENDVIKKPDYPILSLLVSGGHTELILSEKENAYIKLGETLDDAVGEAFDKVARMLGLPYPGGPQISKLSEEVRSGSAIDRYNFPRPMEKSNDFNFSYSGLKTAVRYKIESENLTEDIKKEIAYSFEEAAISVLLSKTIKALEKYEPKTLSIGGGVSANQYLRKCIQKIGEEKDIDVKTPSIHLSTDNAVMIAISGFLKFNDNASSSIKKLEDISVYSNLSI